MKHTSKTATDTLNTQLNVEETNNSVSSDDLTVNEKWGDSPIWIRGSKETGYFVTIGLNRISEIFENKEELEAILPHPDTTTLLLNAALISMEKWIENEINRMTTEHEKELERLKENEQEIARQ